MIPHEITFSAYGQDPNSGKIFWIDNYSITIDEYAGYVELEMSGRFFHPDHGYVTLSTDQIFVLHDGDEWPASGILIVTGANNSKVKLTANDNVTCSVDVDADGDDAYEWTSGLMNWVDL